MHEVLQHNKEICVQVQGFITLTHITHTRIFVFTITNITHVHPSGTRCSYLLDFVGKLLCRLAILSGYCWEPTGMETKHKKAMLRRQSEQLEQQKY